MPKSSKCSNPEQLEREESLMLDREIQEAFASRGFHFVDYFSSFCYNYEDTYSFVDSYCCCSIDENRQEPQAECEELENKVPPQPTLSPELEKKLDEVILELRKAGVSDEFIHAWLDEHVTLSHITITRQHKIILNDYGSVEVEMGPLPKTVFLFYLRHPEGVPFKCLQDYKQELMDIYGMLTACDDPLVVEERISALVNPIANSINEKCSAIKRAFTHAAGISAGLHYCVSGKQGEAKKIGLDRELVIWE